MDGPFDIQPAAELKMSLVEIAAVQGGGGEVISRYIAGVVAVQVITEDVLPGIAGSGVGIAELGPSLAGGTAEGPLRLPAPARIFVQGKRVK